MNDSIFRDTELIANAIKIEGEVLQTAAKVVTVLGVAKTARATGAGIAIGIGIEAVVNGIIDVESRDVVA